MHSPRARTCFLDIWQWERSRWRGEHAFWSFDWAMLWRCHLNVGGIWFNRIKGNWFWDHKNEGHDRVICKSLPNWGLEPSIWLKLRTWMQICIEKVHCRKTMAPKIGKSRAKLNPLSSTSSIGKSWGSCPLPLSFVAYGGQAWPLTYVWLFVLGFFSSSSSSSPCFEFWWIVINMTDPFFFFFLHLLLLFFFSLCSLQIIVFWVFYVLFFLLHMCMMSLISFVVMANGLSEIITKLTIWIVIVIISLDNKWI